MIGNWFTAVPLGLNPLLPLELFEFKDKQMLPYSWVLNGLREELPTGSQDSLTIFSTTLPSLAIIHQL